MEKEILMTEKGLMEWLGLKSRGSIYQLRKRGLPYHSASKTNRLYLESEVIAFVKKLKGIEDPEIDKDPKMTCNNDKITSNGDAVECNTEQPKP